jgi:hypothetical protein
LLDFLLLSKLIYTYLISKKHKNRNQIKVYNYKKANKKSPRKHCPMIRAK